MRGEFREFVTLQRFLETLSSSSTVRFFHAVSSKGRNLLSCILVHSYDYQTLDYDIMLIKLFHPVKVTESVAPIPLPTGCPYGGLMCSVSGWGKTSNDENGELTFFFSRFSHIPYLLKHNFI